MLHQVGGFVFDSCLWSAVGDGCEAEAVFVKVTGLFRVSNVELNIVYSFDRQRVVLQFWIGWIVLRLNLLTYFSTSEIGGYEINSRLEKIIGEEA